jgi:hypothetical protein
MFSRIHLTILFATLLAVVGGLSAPAQAQTWTVTYDTATTANFDVGGAIAATIASAAEGGTLGERFKLPVNPWDVCIAGTKWSDYSPFEDGPGLWSWAGMAQTVIRVGRVSIAPLAAARWYYTFTVGAPEAWLDRIAECRRANDEYSALVHGTQEQIQGNFNRALGR